MEKYNSIENLSNEQVMELYDDILSTSTESFLIGEEVYNCFCTGYCVCDDGYYNSASTYWDMFDSPSCTATSGYSGTGIRYLTLCQSQPGYRGDKPCQFGHTWSSYWDCREI